MTKRKSCAALLRKARWYVRAFRTTRVNRVPICSESMQSDAEATEMRIDAALEDGRE